MHSDRLHQARRLGLVIGGGRAKLGVRGRSPRPPEAMEVWGKSPQELAIFEDLCPK